MNSGASLNLNSLLIASSLILISLFFSYYQKLKLEKDIVIGVLRAIIQLTIVGYLLNFIFGLKNPLFTLLLLIFMTFNASYNAAKRGNGIKNSLLISFISISLGTFITLSILIASNAIKFVPYQIIPIGGMVISNSMVAIGLCYKQMLSNFKHRRDEVETKLCLGSTPLEASKEIIKDCIKTAMQPTIDSMKTLGIVALPGMMTGLILAGTSPLEAIKFQILVTFMLLSITSIASFTASYLSYKCFFNKHKQPTF